MYRGGLLRVVGTQDTLYFIFFRLLAEWGGALYEVPYMSVFKAHKKEEAAHYFRY